MGASINSHETHDEKIQSDASDAARRRLKIYILSSSLTQIRLWEVFKSCTLCVLEFEYLWHAGRETRMGVRSHLMELQPLAYLIINYC